MVQGGWAAMDVEDIGKAIFVTPRDGVVVSEIVMLLEVSVL